MCKDFTPTDEDEEFDDSKIICVSCGKISPEYGYCNVDGSAFCDECWNDHVQECKKCRKIELEENGN